MPAAVETPTRTQAPPAVPAAGRQAEPASPPDSPRPELYRPDWWALQVWVARAFLMTWLLVLDALQRLWKWAF